LPWNGSESIKLNKQSIKMESFLNIVYVGKEHQSIEDLKQKPFVSMTTLDNNVQAVNFLNEKGKPDAIICDFNLPGNDGLFLFDWLREQAVYNNIPFILLDTKFSIELYKRALDKGVDDYYITSSDLSEILSRRIQFLCSFKKNTIGPDPVQNAFLMY
jgi:CheY-like chemotaxis protein